MRSMLLAKARTAHARCQTPLSVCSNSVLTFSIANDGAGYALDNFPGGLPADIKTELDSFAAKIKSGALTPPADIPK